MTPAAKVRRTAEEWTKEAARLRTKRAALTARYEYQLELERYKRSRSKLRKLGRATVSAYRIYKRMRA